jgi:DNA-binding MarR family transcriptional regulator
MLALMRMSGYIASASAAEDKRRHILVPTEKLRATHRDRWESVAAALREVRPDAAAAINLDDPEFVAAYVRITADHFLAGFRMVEVAPDMELFIERNGGLMVLFSILLAGKSDDTVPPKQPVAVSISAIANRFGVSRVHVRTLLRDAEEAGLIRREDAGHVVVLPRLAEAAEIFLATALLFVAMCAHEAHDEVYGRK